MPSSHKKIASVAIGLFLAATLGAASVVHGATLSEDQLRDRIAESNQKLLEAQKAYDAASALYNSTSKQATTLKNVLNTLEANKKKLEAQLTLTSSKITKTTLTLGELADEIDEIQSKIRESSDAVAENIRLMQTAEQSTVIENIFGEGTLSSAWDYINSMRTVQARIAANLTSLHDLEERLSKQRAEAETQKASLVSLQKDLAGQKVAAQATADEKSKLLTQTQNDAAKYQTQLAAAAAQKAEFEKELFEYESQLQIVIDPSSVASARSGLLEWPLRDKYITQYFGYTAAAAKLYKTTGKHGGIDMRAAIGTPVYAALTGVVTDTEAVKSKAGCQYGKFVLIQHSNGLSTIYGHLSVVDVKPGDTVAIGDRIGLSGQTGYATGPHLHFGVYATQGIRIVDSKALGSGTCAGIKTVAADPKAYLDPLTYLPAL